MSKHQQVQLLEAAAILSHLSPDSATGTSLPDDRSLWPAYLSNGTLPPPEGTNLPVAASPDATTRGVSGGPRLHDYSIPISASEGGAITQVRPGLIGVSNTQYRDAQPSQSWGAASSYRSNWSVPRSSVRSDSSGDDDDSVVDIEMDENEEQQSVAVAPDSTRARRVWKREDEDGMFAHGFPEEDEELEDVKSPAAAATALQQEEWDGLEMDMDMD